MSLHEVNMSDYDHKRTIIHFDIDCFYAQVEMIRNPSFRGKPLGIQQKNIMVTCNYEARKWGLTKLMYISEAQKKCPDLIITSGEDLTNYRSMSYRISDFIQKYTPLVERLGFDENFADVTAMVDDRIKKGNFEPKFIGNVYEFEDEPGNLDRDSSSVPVCTCGCLLRTQVGSQIAADIREGLKHELQITSCGGISHNKLLAKLVGSIHKPNQQTSVLPHLGCQLVSSLPGIRSIPGIGSSSTKRLKARGIDSIWDLQQTQLSMLEEEFGKPMAETFSKLCLGIDTSPVVSFTLPQTISDEDSFKCCNTLEDAKNRIHQLILSLLQRLKDDSRIPSTIRLTVRGKDYIRNSRQCPIPANVMKGIDKADGLDIISARLMPLLFSLLYKLVDVSQPFNLTLINVCFAKLVSPNSKQNTLDSFFRNTLKGNHSESDGSEPCLQNKLTENESMTVKENDAVRPSCQVEEEDNVDTSCNSNSESIEFSHSKSPPHLERQNTCVEQLRKLLPKCVDAQELLQLPVCIQNEVLVGYGIKTNISEDGLRVYSLMNKVSTRSQHLSEAFHKRKNKTVNEISGGSSRKKQLFSPRKRQAKNSDRRLVVTSVKENNSFDFDASNKKQKLDYGEDIISLETDIVSDCQSDCVTREECSSYSYSSVENSVSTPYAVSSSTNDSTSNEIPPFSQCQNSKVPTTLSFMSNHGVDKGLTPGRDTVSSVSSRGERTAAPKDNLQCASQPKSKLDSHSHNMEMETGIHPSGSASTENDVNQLPSANCRPVDMDVKHKYSVFEALGEELGTLDSAHSQNNYRSGGSGSKIGQQAVSSCKALATNCVVPENKLSQLSKARKKCPEGIDPSVFHSLPASIQGEILAHNAMGTGSLFVETSPQLQQSSSDTFGHHRCIGTSPRHSVSKKTNGKRDTSQKDILNYFKKK